MHGRSHRVSGTREQTKLQEARGNECSIARKKRITRK